MFELSGIWKFSEAFEFLLNLDSTWHLKIYLNIPYKYLRKSMRGANMTLQKCQKKNIAKKFEFKFEIYLGFPENCFFWSLSFTSEKCPRYRINFPWEFWYIYVLYNNNIYISILPLISNSKKRGKARGPSQANQPSQRQPA